MAFSNKSYLSSDTDNSSRGYAIAADHSSYKYYNNFSISFWVQAGPAQGTTAKHIVSSYDDNAVNKRCFLFSVQIDGTMRLLLSHDGSTLANYKTSSAVFDNTWAHYVFTFASGTFALYRNAVLQSLTATTPWSAGAVALFTSNLQI